ncbi:hypothetical protein ACFL1T_02610 [Chlamydiota bacterium]
MTEKKCIVCIGKDWQESPTSNNHIMSILAKENTVLWLNSTGLRTPSLTSSHDLKKIIKKISQHIKGLLCIKDNLYVYTPLVLPFPKYTLIRKVNELLFRFILRRILKKLKVKNSEIWLFYPTAYDLIKRVKRDILIYYCTDEWSQFSYLNSRLMKQTERHVLKDADIVFTTSKVLFQSKKKYNKNTYYMPHGVDYELFSDEQLKSLTAPIDIINIRNPIIGFYGLIQDWIDFFLIRKIAETHPEWSLVLIGKIATDISVIKDINNIFLLGEKKYKLLPLYAQSFAVGIIPYNMRDVRMHTVNPTKLFQYLAVGLPTVCVDLPEVRDYNSIVSIAKTDKEFIELIEENLTSDTLEKRMNRRAAVKNETWDKRVEKIQAIINHYKK